MCSRRVVAICGKGGTGKTAIAALLARSLRRLEPGARLLLIDADPAQGLTLALGVEGRRTLGQVREEILRRARSADDAEKGRLAGAIDYYLLEALVEREDYCLLSMGRGESAGCFCPVNALLREAIDTLAGDFDRVIIDGEAGIEQIARQVMRAVDVLLLVSDQSARGLRTAALIRDLAQRGLLDAGQPLLLVNRVAEAARALRAAAGLGLEPSFLLPDDPLVGEWDMGSRPLYDLPGDTPFAREVHRLAEWLTSAPR